MQVNKCDRHDEVGLARIMHCGWYKDVVVKSAESHAVKSLLCSSAPVSDKHRRLIIREIVSALEIMQTYCQPRWLDGRLAYIEHWDVQEKISPPEMWDNSGKL